MSAALVFLQRSRALTLVAFPLSHLALLQDASRVPLTASQALASRPDAVAVLDGPMGGFCPGVEQTRSYARASCGEVDTLLYDALTGVRDAGRRPGNGLTFALLGSELHVARGEQFPQGADLVVQTYPSLVEDGRNTASRTRDTNAVWRAAFGVLRDGRGFFAVGVASMADFAERLVAAGAQWAGYTDGGGSAAILARGEARVGDAENRRVFSWLAVLAEARPGTSGTSSLVVNSSRPPTQSPPAPWESRPGPPPSPERGLSTGQKAGAAGLLVLLTLLVLKSQTRPR